MKYFILISFMLFSFIGEAQVVIKGKIKNYDGKSKVYYNPTEDGIITAYANSKEILPNSNGSFKIKYENKGYGTVRISFDHLSFAFFHDEHAEINFVIDQAKINYPETHAGNYTKLDHIRDSVKQVATEVIEGDFADINRFYNSTVRSSTLALIVDGCDFSLLIQKAPTPHRTIAIIDSLTQIEVTQINNLGNQVSSEQPELNKATPEIKQFLINQVYAFYGSIFLNGMMLKRVEQGRKLIRDPNAPLTIYNQEWEKLIEQFFAKTAKKIKPAANSFEYNEFILNMAFTMSDYKKYDFKPPTTTNDELVVERLLRPELNGLDSLFLLNSKVLLAYKLHNLSRFLFTQTFYSPTLLYAINEMKSQYPNSAHIAHFEPQIEKLKAYLASTADQYDKAKIIETNYVHFTDLLERFRGQNLLIDVWATWCGPCVEDFKYKSLIKPFIDKGKITMLYISIDQPKWEKKWRENMKFNQLEGYHVLADEVLIQDMWHFLGGRQGAIPRYALIDKDGNLFLKDAARPSESEKLIEQVDSLVQVNKNE